MVEEPESESALFPERVGDRLRVARIKAGLDLSDVATKTRVPLRHLLAIETGDYSALPSATYCVGFTKAYARCVGEDEVALARQLRGELGQLPPEERYEAAILDDDQTGPVPSRKLALTAAVIAALLVGGYFLWRNMAFDGSNASPVAEASQTPLTQEGEAVAPPVAAPADPRGEVVLTAREAVWLRIYDAKDKVLFEKEMAQGEKFAVPGDANNPMIRTGRADLLTVTVDGKEVPALGPAERTVKDVGISASALAARAAPVLLPSSTAAAPVQQ
jgi:cytoskeleton protein RodZ